MFLTDIMVYLYDLSDDMLNLTEKDFPEWMVEDISDDEVTFSNPSEGDFTAADLSNICEREFPGWMLEKEEEVTKDDDITFINPLQGWISEAAPNHEEIVLLDLSQEDSTVGTVTFGSNNDNIHLHPPPEYPGSDGYFLDMCLIPWEEMTE